MRRSSLLVLALLLAVLAPHAAAQDVPAPEEVFGFRPGADYEVADYDQMLAYYRRLDAASGRVKLQEIGTTSMGRPMLLLFISSAENIDRLDHWRAISEKLARARISRNEARKLAHEGKAVVWIDAGMHATEMAGAQMTPVLAYRVATEETPEMQKIRENVVLLLMPVLNPDGLHIVASWYERVLGTPYETTSPPWLYQKYVGHDNNRDWFMNNMSETQAVSEVLYREWYPQIVLNHHQTAPNWARIFIPPFSAPVNPRIHPGVIAGVNQVGAAMASRFAMKEMPGVVSDVGYTMFWNGGMRTTPFFHNQIGLLTEVAHATPTPRYYEPDSLPERVAGYRTDGTAIFYPDPWLGGESHFRDAVDYMVTASMATLDLAADRSEEFLFNIYRMGRDAIAAGRQGDPYAYIIPTEQWDPGEATNLVNVLRHGGVEVHRAAERFSAGGETYEQGAYVIYAAQAFRPYLMDLLEPQDYPTRYEYPGGPPDPPYDLAGWTLPMQMGVEVDRLDARFEAATTPVRGFIEPRPGRVAGNASYGWALSHCPNASAEAVNRLLAAGATIYWSGGAFLAADSTRPAGTFVIERSRGTQKRVEVLAAELGLDFRGLAEKPNVSLHRMERPCVGLYKSWVANIDEGWTRWLLQRYAFEVDTLHDATIRGGNLAAYDAIILPDQWAGGLLHGHRPGTMPEAYVGGLGVEGAAVLKHYVEQGGTLIAFDSAADFAIEQLGLPVRNVVEGLSTTEFFIPGSLIRMDVRTGRPMAAGMQNEVAAAFSRSRAFETIRPDQMGEGGRSDIEAPPPLPIGVVARYAEDDLLMSGWALGEEQHIAGKAALMNVPLGEGNVVLFGFRPQFRGQSRGTYKLIFNALHLAAMDAPPEARPEPHQTE